MSRPNVTRTRTAVRRRLPLGATVLDLAPAAAFLAAMVVERLGSAERIGGRMPAALGLSVLIAAALAARRRLPLAAYVVGSAALSVEALFVLPSPVTPYANLLGLYSLGLRGTRARARLGPVVVLAGMVAYFSGPTHTYQMVPAAVLFVWLLAWALGYGWARRLEEQEAARGVLRDRVVAEERVRIARELHDLVGHTLNVLLVQTGAARRLLDRDPEQTRSLLGTMEHTGRQALDELDRVLGLLRHEEPVGQPGTPSGRGSGTGTEPRTERGAESGTAPDGQPGLAQLASLTGRMEQAGIRVTIRVDPAAHRLPRPLDLSAYRIVQEALTNTVKHGRATRAEVSVHRAGDVLDIEVRDHGVGVPDGYVPGRGLRGIAERVREFGGRVEHGPSEDGTGERGGFRLHAVLPIPDASAVRDTTTVATTPAIPDTTAVPTTPAAVVR